MVPTCGRRLTSVRFGRCPSERLEVRFMFVLATVSDAVLIASCVHGISFQFSMDFIRDMDMIIKLRIC